MPQSPERPNERNLVSCPHLKQETLKKISLEKLPRILLETKKQKNKKKKKKP